MKKFFLIMGIICSVATLMLLILLIFGLVRAFQNTEGGGNPILIAIIFLGPPLLIVGFAAWACWIYYADQPGKKRKIAR